MIWELLLIISVAGIFIILVRKLPSARQKFREFEEHQPPQSSSLKTVSLPAPTPKRIPNSKQGPLLKASQASPVKQNPPARKVNEGLSEFQDKTGATAPVKLPDVVSEEAADGAFRAGRYLEAKQMYHILLREEGDRPKYHNRLGILSLELGEVHEARDAFRRALKFGEHIASRHANLAMAEYALGHRLTAVQHLKKAMALAPNRKQYEDLLDQIESGKVI